MDTHLHISTNHVLDGMPFGVIQVDVSGKAVYANQAVYVLTGMDKQLDIVGRHYLEFPWDQFDEHEYPLDPSGHVLHQALENEKTVSVIQGTYFQDHLKWFSVQAAPLYEDQKLIGGIMQLTDVTEQVERDKKNQSESARYKTLVENIEGVVWETKLGTQSFSYVSPRAKDLLGFEKEDWFKEGFWQSRLHEEDKERVLNTENENVQAKQNYRLEYRLIHKSGKLVWVRDHVEVVKNHQGAPIGLRGITLDITDSKTSRILLKQSERRYKKMIAEAPYAITIYDKNGVLIDANSKCEEYWMVNLKEEIGKFNIFENDLFIEEKQKEKISQAFQGKRGEISTSISLTHAGQSKKNYHLKYFPLFDENNQLEHVIYFTDDITDLVDAEQKTKREESLKQGVLDALNEGIMVVDAEGTIISINENLKKYVKKQPYSDVGLGKSAFSFMQYFDNASYLKSGLQSILGGHVKVLDHEMRLPDGKWYNLRATPLLEPFGAVISWQNINTRKEIEIALELSLEKYRNIYNKAPVMMHSLNHNLEIISVSDFWLDKMGYERNEVIGRRFMDFIHSGFNLRQVDEFKQAASNGELRNVAYQYKKRSGEVMDVLLSAVPEYDEQGNLERLIAGMLDVTEQMAAEQKLKDSQAKLLEAQRISKIANYEYDVLEGTFEPSPEMISMMGFAKSDRDVSIIEKLIHPEDLPLFSEKLSTAIKGAKDFFHIYRIYHLITKKVKWISGRGKMIRGANGKVVKMIGTVQDISEQKHAEDKIRKLTDRVLLAAEIANLGVWEYDRESSEIFWEDQMYAIFSDVLKPLNYHDALKYLQKEARAELKQNLKAIKSGINFLENDFKVNVEGHEKYLRTFTRVLRDTSSRVTGMIGVVYDITTDMQSQKQLEASLEEKNILIKEVHHRVKNNLQLISSILALKSYDLVDQKSKAVFNDVNDRIKAMSVIHDKLYTFYNVSEIDISEYLTHIASELQIIQGPSRISIQVKAKRIVLDVEKALLIGLMVSEMVSNALKHSFTAEEEGEIVIQFEKIKRNYVLCVSSNGKNMTQEILDSNSGLGISLIKTFVKQLYGKLEIDMETNGIKATF